MSMSAIAWIVTRGFATRRCPAVARANRAGTGRSA